MRDLRDKGAVVTGGASGIGRGIAEALIEAGARVVIADIEAERLAHTAGELGVIGIVVDVADADAVATLANQAMATLGRVDVLINNAGVGSVGRIAELTLADWQWMLDVNLWGVINGIHAFLPILRSNPDGGHMVNTASMSGLSPLPNLGAYAAAKSAVVALSEALALELEEDGSAVGVSVLCCGPTRTDFAHSSRNRVGGQSGGLYDMALKDDPQHPLPWRFPEEIGRLTVAAIRERRLHVFTHPEMFGRVTNRYQQMRVEVGLPPLV